MSAALSPGPDEPVRYLPAEELPLDGFAEDDRADTRATSRDLDHASPHHQGSRTCECNLVPQCRHCHRCKQADGGQLEQPQPGVLVWRTPAGRTYTTTPAQYAA
jgi:hypothetical protein